MNSQLRLAVTDQWEGETSVRRYILTGAPGAGKTAVLGALREMGYAVVDEAATDVIARELAKGRDESHLGPKFMDDIVRLQRERQERPVPPTTEVQLYDRSPVCTLALARYAGLPVSSAVNDEVDRVLRAGIYARQVFYFELLGFVTPTAARRITYEQSVSFDRFHEQSYLDHGFELVRIPKSTVEERAALIHSYISGW